MFGKIFSSMFTGSMMGAGGHVHSTMVYAVSNADEQGYVELNPDLLATVIGEPRERIDEAIAYLCATDPKSRTPTEDGRRIVREGQFLYRIVNYGKYRDIRNQEERRRQNREAKRRQREREKSAGVSIRQQCQPKQKQKYSFCPNSDEFRLAKLLFDLIRERKPDVKEANLQKWAVHVDRMIRLDKRTPERIEAVIRWCQADVIPRGPKRFCWANNILCTEKLREQFDQLELKMATASGGNGEFEAAPADPEAVKEHEARKRELMGAGCED